MKEKTVKVSGREYQRQLQKRMEAMIEQANALRDEAAEKMDEVPSGYELVTWKLIIQKLAKVLGTILVVAAVTVGCIYGMVYDYYIIPIAIFATIFFIALITPPRSARQELQEYYVDDQCYAMLVDELQWLKDGIAGYDQQYAEQKEMIEQFRDLIPEIAARGGTLELVLKADNFHAHVELQNERRKMNCDLDFSLENYSWLATGMYAFTELTAQPEPAS